MKKPMMMAFGCALAIVAIVFCTVKLRDIYLAHEIAQLTHCYEACQWFRAVAQNGYGNFEYVPDVIEAEGCGPEVSDSWILSAAETGNSDAIYWLAVCHLSGQGVSRSKKMFEELVALAADGGHSLAKCVVGCEKWYGLIPGTRDEGLELVREAEKQGSISAYKHLEKLDKTRSL